MEKEVVFHLEYEFPVAVYITLETDTPEYFPNPAYVHHGELYRIINTLQDHSLIKRFGDRVSFFPHKSLFSIHTKLILNRDMNWRFHCEVWLVDLVRQIDSKRIILALLTSLTSKRSQTRRLGPDLIRYLYGFL